MSSKSVRVLFSILLTAVFVLSLPMAAYADIGETVSQNVYVYSDQSPDASIVASESSESVHAAAVDGALSAHVAGIDSTWQTYAVDYGGSVTLAVEASSDSAISYAWFQYDGDWSNFTPLSEKRNTLTVTNLTQARNYNCSVSDANGNFISISFHVEIENHMNLTFYCNGDPVYDGSYYAAIGESVTIQAVVTADNISNLSYEWIDNDAGYQVIEGATTNTITINSLDKVYHYSVNVTDCYGNVHGNQIQIGIENHLSVTPVNHEYTVFTAKNSSAHLAVEVSADNPSGITYQWNSHVYMSEHSYSVQPIAGATNAYYDTGAINSAQHYSCEVTDIYGNMERISLTATVQNHLSVQSADGANNKTVAYGANTTLSVVLSADDMTNLAFAWYYMEPHGEGRYIQTNPVEGASGTTCILRSITEECRVMAQVTDLYGTTKGVMFHIMIGDPSNVTYTWAADNSSVTASNGTTQETVSTYRTVISRPTENSAGTYAIVSNPFQNSSFTEQSKTGFQIPALKNMNVLRLPADLQEVGANSFEDTSIQAVIVPAGCRMIAEGAFKDCSQLLYVQLLSRNTTIGEDAFGNNVVIDFMS